MLKRNQGITLIALVVTIIVLLILTGVTLSFVAGENGILKRATEAVDINEKATAEEEANLLVADLVTQYYEEKYVNQKEVGKLDEYLKTALGSQKETNGGYHVISDTEGNVTVSKNEKPISKGVIANGKVNWEESLNEGNKPTLPKPEDSTEGKTDTSKNRTLAGETTGYTYKNPVIPQGFKAVDTEAVWTYKDTNKTEVTGWNDGLVIEDEIGNQFVWVPVDGIDVKYEKNFSYPSDLGAGQSNLSDATDTIILEGVTYSSIPIEEDRQIKNYGGFYVAKYEAGLPTETTEQSAALNNVYTEIPVSKLGSKIWNFIDYTHSYVAANKMINNSTIYGNNKSGLMTGTQWDTIMKWYENAGIEVNQAQDWGTYYNLPYNGTGLYFTYSNAASAWTMGDFSHIAGKAPYHYHGSGLNSNGIKKNIADIGGNMWEWISEGYGNNRILRAGVVHNTTTNYPASYRINREVYATNWHMGFRPVLYVQ